jgi:hypothetical protein
LLLLQGSVSAATWQYTPGSGADVETSIADGVMKIRTTGSDPFVMGQLSELHPEDCVLEFDFICETGVDRVQIYLGPPVSENATCDLPGFSSGNTWKTYAGEIRGKAANALANKSTLMRVDFGSNAGVQIQLRNLRLRPPTAAEIEQRLLHEQAKQRKQEEAARISQYLKDSFSVSMESVKVATDQIVLTGRSIPSSIKLADLRLIEYPAWHSVGNPDAGIPVNVALKLDGEDWRATVPRRVSGRDRLHSGWRLRYEKGDEQKFVSARHFASEIDLLTNHFPEQPLRPSNQKGMGGITSDLPLDELLELGVTAITVNMPLNAFIAEHESPLHERLDAPGQAVYLNSNGFLRYDPIIQWAHKHNIVVTAILLVSVPTNRATLPPMVHPDNDAGPYSMPDLTTERGAIIYAQVLDAIMRHYNNSPDSPGPISDWIAHNEIDYHHIWTNMGRQPREIVTETYYRSMRMIHNAARQYNPHARVFTSTTHFWHVPSEGLLTRLAPREMYGALQRYSLAEGDFGWGVGTHPYPYDLNAAVAWNDTILTDDSETIMISMQNIEVLERFLKQPSMLDSTERLRPVIFSEQGYHSVSYSEPDQANQAGSLAYAMRRISAMPMVESFHYHRWIDHPGEAGSLFGLRTLPTKEDPFGKKKRSWEVYKAIGTPNESTVVRGLPSPQ